jgi:hypothetical protein
MSALRAACLTTIGTHVPVTNESAAPGGRALDGMCVTASRDDEHARVVHVSTVRDIPSRNGWYRVRVWRELTTVSPN